MKWEDVHTYRNLAEEGKVKFLTCPDDDSKLISQFGEDDEPVFWCPGCDNVIKPGLDLQGQIRAVVREHTMR